MLGRLEAADERGKQQRDVETRVASAGSPGSERACRAAALERPTHRKERRADDRPALGVGVEHEPRPVRSGLRARD